MSISGRVKAVLYTLGLGIASNAGWYAIQRSWSHFDLDLHTASQFLYFVFVAGLGVFIGTRISRKELTHQQRQRLEELQREASFLWDNRSEHSSFLWQEHRKQWVVYTTNAIADHLVISRKAAERRLCDCPAMKSADETEYLECHMKNLKTIIDSSS